MPHQNDLSDLDLSRLLYIVVGAHIRAERDHRPIAYRLRERILGFYDDRSARDSSAGDALSIDDYPVEVIREPVVCSDVWFVNQPALAGAAAALAVGGPDVNALSARLAHELPTAFAVDGVFEIRMEIELNDRRAALWGVNVSATVSAVDCFVERYLAMFIRAAHDLPPQER